MIYINEYDVINKYYEKFHDIHRVVSILLRGYSRTTWTAQSNLDKWSMIFSNVHTKSMTYPT